MCVCVCVRVCVCVCVCDPIVSAIRSKHERRTQEGDKIELGDSLVATVEVLHASVEEDFD